jgi:hypothetical protein
MRLRRRRCVRSRGSTCRTSPHVVDGIDAAALADYAGICGLLLAKRHARTSGASMISGYLGRTDKADDALCRFAQRCSDQTERDHSALRAAVDRGLLPCDSGV